MTVADLIERYMSSFDETVALVYLLRCSGAIAAAVRRRSCASSTCS